ncbi:hypothetical protein FHX52_0802 [Humibacillus xanthopallidus]|uniref:Uncharacterized protein n=1 Tax=Humibacillus xanthopallidus TaxID=412689 RepID=A0A543PUE5_9MICO|nr:hypothetical protein [Humibacillus xanthopallidus]TQN47693.1 hypothetical protein FHX52_0802 [Humibacillus xanthopallidus]
MPTAAEIERLDALIGRLVPLSSKQRGELIAADDWNLLVGALIEVGRAALGARGADEAVPPHEHPDQVGIGWLDPRVRQLVTGGGVKDPAVETEFLKIRRDITTLTTRVDRVGTDVDQSRVRIDEVATNDLVRESLLNTLNRKVLGAADDRGDIADLRGTLRTLRTEVGRAVEVGARLERDGEPIDVPGMVDRLVAVEVLRDRLTRPDGELLDASALEIRLGKLQSGLVTQDELTNAIDDVRHDLPTGGIETAPILDAARLAGRESAADAVDTLGSGLRSELSSRFANLGPVVATAVAEATQSLRADVLAAARSDLDSALSAVDASIRADVTGLVEERISRTGSVIDQRLAGLPALIDAQVTKQVEGRLASSLASVTGWLDRLQRDVAVLSEQTKANRDAISGVDLRLETARRTDSAERARTRSELLERIAGVEAQIPTRVATAVDDARASLRTEIDSSVAASRRDLETRLTQVARDAAATEVRVLSTGIRTDLTTLVRREVDVNLTTARGDMSTEIAGINQRVAGMVSNEVAKATAEIPRLVTNEIDTFRPEINRIVDTRLTAVNRGRPQ